MIRLLIVIVGLFLIWLLFLSSFTKRRKIIIATVVLVMSVLGIWLESNTDLPRANVVSVNDISDCGVVATHSYRSNFDLKICLRNNASGGQVKQLDLLVVAENCTAPNNCVLLEKVQRDVSVDIAPNSETVFAQNLGFDQVEPAATGVKWSAEIRAVKAIR